MLDRARLPNGWWLVGDAELLPLPDGYTSLRVVTLATAFRPDGSIEPGPPPELAVRCKSVFGVVSERSAVAVDIYGLSREQRLSLASDDDMLATARGFAG